MIIGGYFLYTKKRLIISVEYSVSIAIIKENECIEKNVKKMSLIVSKFIFRFLSIVYYCICIEVNDIRKLNFIPNVFMLACNIVK
jgi:hypothetical protein